ncbi:hypothetical protein ACHAW5_002704 [Stephanodiscus triporus]|uniref:Dolichol-phosphate mannosyltransferase subunit 1 n=1 Tax=Stephanodiscus triporus TaxID=2934178 RepID=A0ABD3MIM2_9STRA
MAMASILHKLKTPRTVCLLLIILSISLNLPSAISLHPNAPISADVESSSCGVGGDHETCSSSLVTRSSSNNNINNNNNHDTMLYSIILPTYNERENLPLITQFLHDAFAESKLKYEIVVVDDSSPDGTLEVARSLQKIFGEERFRIVSRPGKLGLGSAYSAGLRASSGGRIVLMDADMSHHPKYIAEMIAMMDGRDGDDSGSSGKKKFDIVSGTRYRRGGGVAGWDTRRKLTSCGANFLATFLLSTGGASDLTGSFRLYERSAIEMILPQVMCKGYAFQMEILVRAHKAGMKIGEVPIVFVDRIYGESKLGANEIIMYLRGLLNLFLTT